MYKKFELQRFVSFYINGNFVFSYPTDYDLPISNICKSFCVSPDVVSKRVFYRLICDYVLPF